MLVVVQPNTPIIYNKHGSAARREKLNRRAMKSILTHYHMEIHIDNNSKLVQLDRTP